MIPLEAAVATKMSPMETREVITGIINLIGKSGLKRPRPASKRDEE